jgi:hypothetical protein
MPKTAKAGTMRFIDFNSLEATSPTTAGSGLSHKERMEYDYLKKRDPMKEFFALVSPFRNIQF